MGPTKRVASMLGSALFAIAIAACSASTAADASGSDAAVSGRCPPPTAVMPVIGNDVWPNSAVPRGSCPSTSTCLMSVDPCCHPAIGDPVDHYTCTCAGGIWQCEVVRGKSICADLDAGIFPSCPESGG